jgi:hypothetical protein
MHRGEAGATGSGSVADDVIGRLGEWIHAGGVVGVVSTAGRDTADQVFDALDVAGAG